MSLFSHFLWPPPVRRLRRLEQLPPGPELRPDWLGHGGRGRGGVNTLSNNINKNMSPIGPLTLCVDGNLILVLTSNFILLTTIEPVLGRGRGLSQSALEAPADRGASGE